MKASARPVHQISLRLHDVSQLFNSMDPTPFLHRDLDPDAEAFIESWAHEFPSTSRLQLIVHLQDAPREGEAGEIISEALHNFFSYKAELTQRELRQLMSVGRRSLLIGLGFLSICLFAANALSRGEIGPTMQIPKESLTIVGWVGMWRPIEIFLYEWWPILRRQRIYENLGHAHVRIEMAEKGDHVHAVETEKPHAAEGGARH
ncbi:MAG: hypothetical protein HYY48_12795 [Gammaproteobacteria bacterium]|nr:hypothetical protein [Gammaproteobacteria bacterium]